MSISFFITNTPITTEDHFKGEVAINFSNTNAARIMGKLGLTVEPMGEIEGQALTSLLNTIDHIFGQAVRTVEEVEDIDRISTIQRLARRALAEGNALAWD